MIRYTLFYNEWTKGCHKANFLITGGTGSFYDNLRCQQCTMMVALWKCTMMVALWKLLVFTRGQFWPSGIVVACVCVCVCLSVNHQLVRAITHQPFKLESPNLDQRCKRPWLRSLFFFGTIDLELQGQIELKSQNLPHFELVHAKSHHQLKSVFPSLGQKCILALLRSLLQGSR